MNQTLQDDRGRGMNDVYRSAADVEIGTIRWRSPDVNTKNEQERRPCLTPSVRRSRDQRVRRQHDNFERVRAAAHERASAHGGERWSHRDKDARPPPQHDPACD